MVKNHQEAFANQLCHNSEPLNDKGLLGWKLAKREDLQQSHQNLPPINFEI